MKLRPGTLGLTALLALMTALGPLSTDLYLPSLPGMARALGADLAQVQLTLSVYLFAFAIGQIVYGPIADRYGRKPTVLAGLVLYCAGSSLCAFAPTTETLIAARAVQAFGAAAPIVLARAIVRDIYDGAQAAKELSRMGMIMGLVPALAPLVGGVLDPLFGWRSNFAALLIAGISLAVGILLLLPETLKQRRPEPLSAGAVLGGFGAIFAHPVFRANTALTSLSFSGLFCFISGSSFVFQNAYGLTPLGFALAFAMMCGGFIGGAVTTQRMVSRWGTTKAKRVGVACLLAGGLSMVSLMLTPAHAYVAVAAPMAVYAFGIGIVLPSANAAAMMPFPDRAGAASSLSGLIQCTAAAATAAAMARILDGFPIAMALTIAGMALAAAAVTMLSQAGREQA
jgi:DHA1 family bicyclomycin/chloramphenicol resistance-like MFS transporter